MKVLWRVAQVLFGILFALALIIVIVGAVTKEAVAIIGGIIIAVIALGLFLLMGRAAKTVSSVQVEPIAYDFRFSGQLIKAEGVNIPIKTVLTVSLAGDTIIIANPTMSFTLNKSQVTYTGIYGEREQVTKDKSTIGRGVAGGLLFGTTGAIVGGLSGASGKHTEKQHTFNFISFNSSTNTPCRLDFEIFSDIWNAQKFNKAVTPTQLSSTEL